MDDAKKKQKEEKLAEELVEEVQNEQEEEQKELEEHVYLKKLIETEDRYKRAIADYQNLVRRTQEEKSEWARLSNRDLVLKLLPILDTLMLAEKHTKDQTFSLTVQQFLQVLKDEGFEKIKAEGEKFDPLVMEVVETRDGDDWKVLEEVKIGIKSGDIIIRPAYVVVGRKKD